MHQAARQETGKDGVVQYCNLPPEALLLYQKPEECQKPEAPRIKTQDITGRVREGSQQFHNNQHQTTHQAINTKTPTTNNSTNDKQTNEKEEVQKIEDTVLRYSKYGKLYSTRQVQH